MGRREWAEQEAAKSNIEKARESIKAGDEWQWAPGSASSYARAICYLLLELLDRLPDA